MKKNIVTLICLVLFGTGLMPLYSQTYSANLPGKAIHIVYDDSGSMIRDDGDVYLDRWAQAKYAMEVFAAMLQENDIMRVYYMSDYATSIGGNTNAPPRLSIMGTEPMLGRAAKVHDTITLASNTPFDPVLKAMDIFRNAYNYLIEPDTLTTPVITPHIHKHWHLISEMPDLNDELQKKQEKTIYKALILGLLYQQIRYDKTTGGKFKYGLWLDNSAKEIRLIVSNGTICDTFYEIIDALTINPVIVKKILSAVGNKLETEQKNNIVKYEQSALFKGINSLILHELSGKGYDTVYTHYNEKAGRFLECKFKGENVSQGWVDKLNADELKYALDCHIENLLSVQSVIQERLLHVKDLTQDKEKELVPVQDISVKFEHMDEGNVKVDGSKLGLAADCPVFDRVNKSAQVSANYFSSVCTYMYARSLLSGVTLKHDNDYQAARVQNAHLASLDNEIKLSRELCSLHGAPANDSSMSNAYLDIKEEVLLELPSKNQLYELAPNKAKNTLKLASSPKMRQSLQYVVNEKYDEGEHYDTGITLDAPYNFIFGMNLVREEIYDRDGAN